MSSASKLVAEAIGTFALCFVGASAICITALQGAGYEGLLGVALAHGLILSIAISATMNVSGGHVNPAVTISMLVTRRISAGGAVGYIAAQLIGGLIAGVCVLAIFKGMTVPGGDATVTEAAKLGTPAYDPGVLTMGKAIFIEALMTFLLVFAVFATAVDPRAPKIGGFGIGLTLAADVLMGGPLTGAAVNPARTMGTGLVAAMAGNFADFWSQQPVYWIGPILGGLAAGLIYDAFVMEKKTP
jgi:aquaporin Z